MKTYVALLRAVNVGGTGKLLMTELKTICEAAGFKSAETYIASGNVVFQSAKTEAQVKAALEKALALYAGKPVGVLIRTAEEMTAVLAASPFKDKPGNQAHAIFLDQPPSSDALSSVSNRTNEELQLGIREVYAYYPEGAGQSKLRIAHCQGWHRSQYEYSSQTRRSGHSTQGVATAASTHYFKLSVFIPPCRRVSLPFQTNTPVNLSGKLIEALVTPPLTSYFTWINPS